MLATGTFFGYNADALQNLADDVMFVDGNPYPGPELKDASNNEGVAGVARAYVTTNDGHGVAVDYHVRHRCGERSVHGRCHLQRLRRRRITWRREPTGS